MTAPEIAQIPMSSELAATLARGADFAGATGASEVSLEHLLAALCDDPDAVAVLDASHISGERLKSDVISRVLGGAAQAAVPIDSLGVSIEVRRILEAAAAAARGSRRRDINGAIVLAAIVGDARSVAAEILEAHGLTFENAIRALQAALQPPREAAPPQHPPVADDVLARARERVQSRSTPSLRDIMKDMPRPAPLDPPPMPAPPAAHAPQPPLPQPPSFDEAAAPESSSEAREEPTGPPVPHRADEPPREPPQIESPKTEPPRPESQQAGPHPSPAASEHAPPPSRPFSPPPPQQEPRLPTGGPAGNQPKPEPSFGAPPGGGPPPRPGQSAPPPGQHAPYPQEPSLPLPSRPPQQAGPSRQDPQGYPLPFPGAPQPSPGPGPNLGPHPASASPPQRDSFDLPPRPQPSRIQPPPIPPAPGLGGPASVQQRPAGPSPASGPSPQFGPPGPSLSPSGPVMAPGPLPNPGQGGAANPNRSAGPNTGFRPGTPIGAPPTQQMPPQPQAQRRAKRGKAANVETGQLAENIPRSMRVGKTVRAEIRIAKASIKALTEGMDGAGPVWQHTVAVTKAMSVRIRAPDGGFFIESASPETQWIESNLGYSSDDFASWRFLITPQYRGWSDLQIIVSARTIGADGVAAETALPDQIVEVKVRANLGRAIVRLFGWSIAAIIGGALATFGEQGMTIVSALMKKFGH